MVDFPQIVKQLLRGEKPVIATAVAETVAGWQRTIAELKAIEGRLAEKGFVPGYIHHPQLGSFSVKDIVRKDLKVPFDPGRGDLPSIAHGSNCCYLPGDTLTPAVKADIAAWRELKIPLVENMQQYALADKHYRGRLVEEIAHVRASGQGSVTDLLRNGEKTAENGAHLMFETLHNGNAAQVTGELTSILEAVETHVRIHNPAPMVGTSPPPPP